MIVYDYSKHAEPILSLLLIFGILLVLGIILFFFSKDIGGEENWVSKLFNIPNKNLNTNKKLFQMLGIMLFLIAIFAISIHLKNYIFYKKMNWFKNIKEISGQIRDVESSEFSGIKMINFKLDSLSFNLIQDECYISPRNLIDSDFVNVDYYDLNGNKQNKIDSKIIVLKIEFNNK